MWLRVGQALLQDICDIYSPGLPKKRELFIQMKIIENVY
jgi:hypothetical protein